MTNLFDKLAGLLKKDERLVSQNGDLLKNQAQELARKSDPELIKTLLSDPALKAHFFSQVVGVTIFDQAKFISFVGSKEFLPDSYTAFKNKIGLVTGEDFLNAGREVVLVWPYKDCILEGGMAKEDQKTEEIFYNETLAPDDITYLLDPKVFTEFKRIDIKGEHKLDGFRRGADGMIKDNLIIKGNNLLALHSLKEEFAGKVKLIYIDPPYNTGNDGFKYNDSFNHSTWLTFMKNRLEVSKELLRDDGVIFVQMDHNEGAYLKVLMDDIFGRSNFRNAITWRKVLSGKKQSINLSNITEYIFVYAKSASFQLNQLFIEAEIENDLKNYPHIEESTGRRYGSFDFTQQGTGQAKFFDGKLLEPPKGKHWIWDQEAITEGIINNRIIFTKSGMPRVKRYLDDKNGNPLSDLWSDDEVKIISANDKERLEFNGQKPEALLRRIIQLSTEKGDIVLDYHAGTGTTLAVAHKIGRQYIGIEQMDYIHDLPESRLIKVIKGDQTGISKAVNWKGGGDFVYMELLEWNEKWMREIQKAKVGKDLIRIWDEIKDSTFLSWRIEPEKVEVKSFEKISVEDQKKFLIDCLNKNHLYVNYSEMEDEDYKISEGDKKLNREFYEN
ncbi:MAG: site-specific DNA-methyltransferase [Candidatus Buchananbacteria bacterium]|jgi:adenine-specific DNA-methyltransferase